MAWRLLCQSVLLTFRFVFDEIITMDRTSTLVVTANVVYVKYFLDYRKNIYYKVSLPDTTASTPLTIQQTVSQRP